MIKKKRNNKRENALKLVIQTMLANQPLLVHHAADLSHSGPITLGPLNNITLSQRRSEIIS